MMQKDYITKRNKNNKSIVCKDCCKITHNYRREFCNNCYRRLMRQNKIEKLPIIPMPETLTNTQKEIIVGSMLGDGNLSLYENDANAKLMINRSLKDEKYLLWEAKYFNEFLSPNGIRQYANFNKKVQKSYPCISFTTRASHIFTKIYNEWYPNNIKTVPQNIEFTSLIMLIWFLDDGHFWYRNNCKKFDTQGNLKLSTHGFTEQEVRFLQEKLINRYGTKFSVYNDAGKFYISAYGKSASNFVDDISPIYPECMFRKAKWKPEVRQALAANSLCYTS